MKLKVLAEDMEEIAVAHNAKERSSLIVMKVGEESEIQILVDHLSRRRTAGRMMKIAVELLAAADKESKRRIKA